MATAIRLGAAGEVEVFDVSEESLTDAARTQRAFGPSLCRLHGNPLTLTREEEATGFAEYRAEFGHGIARRHWWRLLNRFLMLDGGARDFSRVALFLSIRLKPRAETSRRPAAASAHLRYLRTTLGYVNHGRLSPAIRATIFVAAFDEMRWLADEGMSEANARRVVLAEIEAAGCELVWPGRNASVPFKEVVRWTLVKPASALERIFGEKLAEYRSGDFDHCSRPRGTTRGDRPR